MDKMQPSRFKFRVWIPRDKNMCLPHPRFYGMSTWSLGTDGQLTGALAPTNAVVMFSTGIADKNGVEIFEGDLVRLGESKPLTVQWHNFGWILTAGKKPNKSSRPLGDLMNSEIQSLEVVGNIYER